jgi:hypothetical protein
MLGWRLRHDDLESIVRTAGGWRQWRPTRAGPAAFGAAYRASPLAELRAR